jgi:hypothetical protein
MAPRYSTSDRSFGGFRHHFASVVAVLDEVLLEELYVDDGLEELFGNSAREPI